MTIDAADKVWIWLKVGGGQVPLSLDMHIHEVLLRCSKFAPFSNKTIKMAQFSSIRLYITVSKNYRK